MPETQTPEAYMQVARGRIEDAKVLLAAGDAERYLGSFYLSGYGVECSLKALLLQRSTAAQRAALVKSFRGKFGHDVDWIRKKLRDRGVRVPKRLARSFASVNTWSVSLRYDTGTKTRHETGTLINSVDTIATWAEGEL
jgi:hypothetical protein